MIPEGSGSKEKKQNLSQQAASLHCWVPALSFISFASVSSTSCSVVTTYVHVYISRMIYLTITWLLFARAKADFLESARLKRPRCF